MKLNNLVSYFLKIFIFITFFLARTFTGFYIFGFRVGELIIGFTLLCLLGYLIFNKQINFLKDFNINDKKIKIYFLLIISSFALIQLVTSASFLNYEIYKTSSYIWSFGGLFFILFFIKVFKFKIYLFDIIMSIFSLLLFYIYSTRGISENTQNMLLNFTDKFEYPKGSDLLLAFIFINYLILQKFKYSQMSINILLLNTSLYLPLFLVKSRSGFFSIILFLLFLFPKFKENLKPSFIKLLPIFIFIFILSTSWIVDKDIVIEDTIDQDIVHIINYRYGSINDNYYEKEVLKLRLFYVREGRLYTTDGNLNWRFQIWQDIIHDMSSNNNIFWGYGHDSLIPAMNSDQRYGFDKANVNVHNYIFHILSRGGLFHVVIIVLIYLEIRKWFKSQNNLFDFNIIFYPLFFNSLFDPSMENAHYPVILYFLLGLALNKSIIFKEIKDST